MVEKGLSVNLFLVTLSFILGAFFGPHIQAQKISILSNASHRVNIERVDYFLAQDQGKTLQHLIFNLKQVPSKFALLLELPKGSREDNFKPGSGLFKQQDYRNWLEHNGLSLWKINDANPCKEGEVASKNRVYTPGVLSPVERDPLVRPFEMTKLSTANFKAPLAGQLKSKFNLPLGFFEYWKNRENIGELFLIEWNIGQGQSHYLRPVLTIALNKGYRTPFPLNLSYKVNRVEVHHMNIWGFSADKVYKWSNNIHQLVPKEQIVPGKVKKHFSAFKKALVSNTFRRNSHRYPLLVKQGPFPLCSRSKKGKRAKKLCTQQQGELFERWLGLNKFFVDANPFLTHFVLDKRVIFHIQADSLMAYKNSGEQIKGRVYARQFWGKREYCAKGEFYHTQQPVLKEIYRQNFIHLTGIRPQESNEWNPGPNTDKKQQNAWWDQFLK
jgi:hypothetical protein